MDEGQAFYVPPTPSALSGASIHVLRPALLKMLHRSFFRALRPHPVSQDRGGIPPPPPAFCHGALHADGVNVYRTKMRQQKRRYGIASILSPACGMALFLLGMSAMGDGLRRGDFSPGIYDLSRDVSSTRSAASAAAPAAVSSSREP